jgi:molecular chaperone GrpE
MGDVPGTDPDAEADPWSASGGPQEAAAGSGVGPDTSAEQAGAVEELFAEEAGVPASPEDPVAQERDEYREALQRLQADFENFRKRMAKQTDEIRERAAESLVEKLLPVLDTADLALSHGGGEDVKQLSSALFSSLEREGLEKIDNAGEAFDPNLHDAVAHEPGDGDGGQEVAEVLRAGYRWRGRVLRAAMVRVRG